MRIERVALKHFRGVGQAEIVMAPSGVTIIQGPNEVGKSSVAEALDLLIRQPDSSKAAEVRAVQPVHADVGPSVEADITVGDLAFTYSKRWIRQPRTELTITHPTREQLTGRGAHERVQQILADATDIELFRALWLRQGEALMQAALGGDGSLGAALDAASGAGDDVEGGGALIDAVAAVRAEWYTDTGREKQALTDLRAAVAGAGDDLATATAAMHELAAAIEGVEALAREVAAHDAAEPGLTIAAAEREAAVVDARALHDAARAARLEADGMARDATDARAALDRRMAQVAAIEDDERRVAEGEDEGRRATSVMADATARRDSCRARLDQARVALDAAEARLARAAGDDDHLREAYDHSALVKRTGEIAAADAVIAAAGAFLDGCPVDDGLMARIERAAEEAAEARAVAGALARTGGANVVVRAEAPISVEGPGGGQRIDAGGESVVPLAPGEAIRIAGVASVGLAAGDAGAVVDRAEQADAALAGLLAQAGVADESDGVAAARALHRMRGAREAELAAARTRRADALNDLERDELQAKLDRSRARMDAYLADRPADLPLPTDRSASKAARAAAGDAVAAARAAHDEARRMHEVAADAVAQAEKQAFGRESGLDVIRDRIAAARAALDAEREVHPDEALRQAADRMAAAAADAVARAEAAEARVADSDLPTLEQRLDNARQALTRLRDERTDARVRQAQLVGVVATRGDEGLADRVAERQAALDDAESALAVAEARARAADHLHGVLVRHRDTARQAYVAPYRAEVERLARSVFGPGTTVEVDHADLRITSRTRDGRTVPFDALSGGAREQLGVIGRLAAAAIAAGEGGGVPVIIDDALGFTDATRLEGLGAALVAAADRTQVIVLTCAPERYATVGAATVVRMSPGAA